MAYHSKKIQFLLFNLLHLKLIPLCFQNHLSYSFNEYLSMTAGDTMLSKICIGSYPYGVSIPLENHQANNYRNKSIITNCIKCYDSEPRGVIRLYYRRAWPSLERGGQEGVSEELTRDLRTEECIKVNQTWWGEWGSISDRGNDISKDPEVDWKCPRRHLTFVKWKKASMPDSKCEEKRIHMSLAFSSTDQTLPHLAGLAK